MAYEEFDDNILEHELLERSQQHIEAFNLRYATANQEDAIRDYAAKAGYTDLRRFKGWMNAAELDYYDVLKIQSPDD